MREFRFRVFRVRGLRFGVKGFGFRVYDADEFQREIEGLFAKRQV